MTLQRFTPRELRDQLSRGRILELVPRTAVQLRQVAQTMVEISWPAGPRGHAIIGMCPELCHFVVEYPQQWRRRGREIAQSILEAEPSTIPLSDDELETLVGRRTLDFIKRIEAQKKRGEQP